MNIFGVGLPEIAVIAALALIVFGPKKLPELGRSLGKTLKSLQNASTDIENEFKKVVTESEEMDPKSDSKSTNQEGSS